MAVQLILLSVWAVRKVGLGISWTHLSQLVAFGLPLIFANLAMFALNFSDRFFLRYLCSLDAVGIYSVGYKVAFMLSYFLVLPFGLMWQSRMYVIYERHDHPRVFRQLFVFYSLLLMYGALWLSVLSPEIMRIMVGPSFVSGGEVIPIVTLGYVFYGIGDYAHLGMLLKNRPRLIGALGIVAAVLNLVLNYTLIRQVGMMGAAAATALSFLALAVGGYWLSYRVFPIKLGVDRVCRALVLTGGVFFLCKWTAPEVLWGALLVKSAWLLFFPFLIWKCRMLAPDEIDTVVGAWIAIRTRIKSDTACAATAGGR
jgi:O-antigen/teichoic acid export membrane protein